jgi:hypothetical protein
LREKGKPVHHFHELGDAQWAYYEWMDRLVTGGQRGYPPVVRELYTRSNARRNEDHEGYRYFILFFILLFIIPTDFNNFKKIKEFLLSDSGATRF